MDAPVLHTHLQHLADKYGGLYRAKVIDNNDPDNYGRVKVFIPELMALLTHEEGLTEEEVAIWAFPAHWMLGGIDPNEESTYGQGQCIIPVVNSWVWVFLERGNPSKPYYIGTIQIKQAPVLPECRVGKQPVNKFVLTKTRSGRTIILSDDYYDERVELTGKKRKLKTSSSEPSGDTDSVYTLKDNQVTILIDEREGKEKILISDYKGNYLTIRIEDEQFHVHCKSDIIIDNEDGDISIQSNKGTIQIYAKDNKIQLIAKDDIDISAEGNILLNSKSDVNIQAKGKVNLISESDSISMMSNKDMFMTCQSANVNIMSLAAVVAIDGSSGVAISSGEAQPAKCKPESEPSPLDKKPIGDRDK